MKKSSELTIHREFELSSSRLDSLNVLYQPLLMTSALTLYLQLYSYSRLKVEASVALFLKNMSLTIKEFNDARLKLEEFSLIKTFKKEEEFLILVKEPLMPMDFLKHYVFGFYFKHKFGPIRYELLLNAFKISEFSLQDYQDITQAFNEDNLKRISEADLILFTKGKVKKEFELPVSFSQKKLFQGVSETVFPSVYRSERNIFLMASLMDLYGIDYKEMKTVMSKAANGGKFSEAILMREARKIRSYDSEKIGYQKSSVQFLEDLQNGLPASESDKRVLEKIVMTYQLNSDVLNVLLESYIHNFKRITKNHLEKIALSWKVENISTIDAAKKYLEKNPLKYEEKKLSNVAKEIKKEKERAIVDLTSDKSSEELLKEVEERLKRL